MSSFWKNSPVKKILLSFLSAVFIIALALIFPSVLNKGIGIYESPTHPLIDNEFMDLFINDHNENPVYFTRKFTNLPLFVISNLFHLNLAHSFLIVQAFYIFIAVYVFLTLTEYLSKKRFAHSVTSLLFFLFSFSILFSFFIPIYTYDDFPQYIFLWLALLAGFKKKYWSLTIFLTLSLLVRESSILLFPSIAILIFGDIVENPRKFFSKTKYFLHNISIFVVPVLIYYLYILIEKLLHPEIFAANVYYLENERFSHLAFNFQNLRYGIESFTVIALVFLATWYVLKQSKTFADDKQKNVLKSSWLLAFIINTPITLLATRAQEARIMALPMVLIWPYLGKYTYDLLQEFPRQLKEYFKKWVKIENLPNLILKILTLGLIWILSLLFIWKVYSPGTNGFPEGYKIYALFTVSLLLFHYLFVKSKE